jgi:dolichol-phosphate mannosyltransferase
VRGLRFARNLGQSAAIYFGLRQATQPLVALMDGDGQNDPADFARLIGALSDSGADVVCGYRAHRHDTWQRRLVSRLGNGIRRALLHDGARDTGCSQKVFRREAGRSSCRFAACTATCRQSFATRACASRRSP